MKPDQESEKEGVTGSKFRALEAKVNYTCKVSSSITQGWTTLL